MTREELKAHCIRQIEQIEMWAKCKGEKPSGKVYEEHKLILELLDSEQKADNEWCTDCKEYDHEKHCCPRFSQVIKTTLQECCENAISREDALLILTGEDLPDDASKLISIFGERIKNLPPVKPQEPRWTPVSEQLPKLVTVGPVWKREVLVTGYLSFDDKKERFVATECIGNVISKKDVNGVHVIAWMPLPKPYQPKDGGNELTELTNPFGDSRFGG